MDDELCYPLGPAVLEVGAVVDGVVLVAPVIQAGITGSILIAGDFDREELEELIDTLVDG